MASPQPLENSSFSVTLTLGPPAGAQSHQVSHWRCRIQTPFWASPSALLSLESVFKQWLGFLIKIYYSVINEAKKKKRPSLSVQWATASISPPSLEHSTLPLSWVRDSQEQDRKPAGLLRLSSGNLVSQQKSPSCLPHQDPSVISSTALDLMKSREN